MITATELLNFLCKAQKLSPSCISLRQTDEGYKISLYLDWCDDNDFYHQSIFVDNEGQSDWNSGDYDFYTMDRILDDELEEQKEKEMKAQKRKELLARLTDEEKELLNLN